MSGRLAGKTALITAAGQGMGHAVRARDGARRRDRLRDRRQREAARRASPACHVHHARKLDVLDDAAVAKLVGGLPPLRRSCSTARASCITARSSTATPKDWDFSINLNVRAMYIAIARGAAEDARSSSRRPAVGSSIINMASIAGSIKGLPNRFVYGTSKAAVIGLTKSIAADYVQKGVRCNAIAPGHRRYAVAGDRINAFDDPVEARKMFIARQPMGRLAKAEEIAPIVVYPRLRRSRVRHRADLFRATAA